MNIFSGIEYEVLRDVDFNRKYDGIEYDSRKVKENYIFVALEGANVDGHDYIDSAVKNGATCIIVSRKVEMKHKVSYVLIDEIRHKLGYLASNFYEWPQRKLKIIGVTGTNGKTSSTYMIEKLMGDTPITRIGTIEYKIGDEVFEAVNTTPESLDLIKIFDKTLKKKIEYVVMEVSSHSLEIGRVDVLDFDYALFTNLTQDHLDYHVTMENYFQAKRKLFLKLKDINNSVFNIDDKYGKRLYDEFIEENPEIISYGIEGGDLEGEYLDDGYIDIKFREKVEKVKFALLGDFNLYNTLGAVAIAVKMGIKWEDILERISNINAAPGRFETLNCGQDYKVIVDYAHTPDALVNVIVAARNIRNGNRIITIFGCGGDRDRTKRPIMAKAAENLSDIVILTSDNPRTESPEQIFADVKTGFAKNDDYFFEPDREKAIKLAVNMAEKNDIILITGKGHETYHIIGTKKWHFDDKEIARREIVRRRMVENVN